MNSDCINEYLRGTHLPSTRRPSGRPPPYASVPRTTDLLHNYSCPGPDPDPQRVTAGDDGVGVGPSPSPVASLAGRTLDPT